MTSKIQLRLAALGMLIFTTLLWLLPVIAWAAETTVTPPPSRALWQTLLLPIVSTVGLFIAAFLTIGLRKLIQLIEAKWKVEVPAAVETLMEEKALQLCAWAEEAAEDKLLHKNGTPTSGAEKADQVITAMTQFATAMGYDKTWQKEKIEQLVKSIVHLNREGSEGVIGSNGSRGKLLAAKEAIAAATPVAVTTTITSAP